MCLAIGFYAIFGIYSEIQILVFGTMAKPLNRMFNDSLFMHYGIQAGAKGYVRTVYSPRMSLSDGVRYLPLQAGLRLVTDLLPRLSGSHSLHNFCFTSAR